MAYTPEKTTTPQTPVGKETPTQELLAAGRALGGVATGTPAGFAPFILKPPGYEVAPLARLDLEPLPDHLRGTVTLRDAESFILYVKAFRTPTARVFASMPDLTNFGKNTGSESSGTVITAYLDYHEGGTEQKSKRLAHIAKYPIPLSLEFRIWLAQNESGMSQTDFAKFIEANAGDVTAPPAADLLDMALNFESKSTASFQSRIDRCTGGRNLVFQEEIENTSAKATGSMKVPEAIKIRLPIFESGKAYEIPARLEYRAQSGKLTITYHLHRPADAFRLALADCRAEIAEALECDILTGAVAV